MVLNLEWTFLGQLLRSFLVVGKTFFEPIFLQILHVSIFSLDFHLREHKWFRHRKSQFSEIKAQSWPYQYFLSVSSITLNTGEYFFRVFPDRFAQSVLIIIRHTQFKQNSPLKCNFYHKNVEIIERKFEK